MKKFIILLAFLVCFSFGAFSQAANTQRYRTLGDSMSRSADSSNARLANYDGMITDNSNDSTYSYYQRQYSFLVVALRESEQRLDFLIRGNDIPARIKAERDTYERLIRRLEELMSEYNAWLRTVQ